RGRRDDVELGESKVWGEIRGRRTTRGAHRRECPGWDEGCHCVLLELAQFLAVMPAKASSIHGTGEFVKAAPQTSTTGDDSTATSSRAMPPREDTSGPPPSARLPGDARSRGTLGREVWMNDGAVARERGRFHDLVVPLDRKRFRVLIHQDFEEGKKVLGVEARSGRGDAARHVWMAPGLDAARLHHFGRPVRFP